MKVVCKATIRGLGALDFIRIGRGQASGQEERGFLADFDVGVAERDDLEMDLVGALLAGIRLNPNNRVE